MVFKSFFGALCACLAVFSFNVSAALIDNGAYTTDTVTGLDWLDLNYTAGMSYNGAVAALDSLEGGGWRYATNEEVEDIFGILFEGYYDTRPEGLSYVGEGEYADQASDIINFHNLFGYVPYTVHTLSYGLYEDENGDIRMVGAWQFTGTGSGAVYGTDLTYEYSADDVNPLNSVFLVRANAEFAVVPVPVAAWLFASGLFGLVAMARHKVA